MTQLGQPRVRPVRTRRANMKFRALRMDKGNFCWGSENTTRKVRIGDVVYNSSNNELVRTKTLVKNAIVLVDATPFRQWYMKKYDVELNKKKIEESNKAREGMKQSGSVKRKIEARNKDQKLEQKVADQFNGGRLFACISSRPGQY